MTTSDSYSSVFTFLAKAAKNGLSKANRYRVTFTLPPGVGSSNQTSALSTSASMRGEQSGLNGGGEISILCSACTFPQRSVMTFDVKQFGPVHRIPFTSIFEPVTFSFYADESLNSRRYFEVWQMAVFNLATNTMNYYDEYVSPIQLEALSTYGDTKYKVKLLEAYPLSVGSIDMAYSNSNQTTTVTVTMSYKYWEQY